MHHESVERGNFVFNTLPGVHGVEKHVSRLSIV